MVGIGATLASALLVSACGSGTSGTSHSGTASGTNGGGSTLTVALPSDISNFDPSTNQLIEYVYAIRNTVFSGLVKYDSQLKIVPDLATPTVNSSATQYTFKLASGAKFQDGEPVNAAAVIASLKRVASGKSIYSSYLSGVGSYSSPDDATVVVNLKTPNAAFLDGLVNIAIVAPQTVGKVGHDPVGSGPYEFVSATANREIVLKRFDGYFGPKAAYSELDYKIVTDPQVAVNDLYSGSVDAASEASVAAVKQLNTSKATAVSPASSNSIAMFELNSKGKLADPRVRQALSYALDRQTVQKVVYSGGGQVTTSVVPSGPYAANVAAYDYDTAKAKSLLAAAGASGLTFTVIIPTGYPEAVQTADIWQSALKSIGVSLTIKTEEVSVWVSAYVKQDYDASWNFFNESGDPNSFFNTIMLPHLQNDYRNPAMLQQITAALSTPDEATRKADYAKLADEVNNDVPVIVIQTRPLAAIVAKGITDLTVNPLGWLLIGQATS